MGLDSAELDSSASESAKNNGFSAKKSDEYKKAVEAASDFGNHRILEEVQSQIHSARLYVNGFRELDVYGPTKIELEQDRAELSIDNRVCIKKVVSALDSLSDLRYSPVPSNFRIFPILRQYDRAAMSAIEYLSSLRRINEEFEVVGQNFVKAMESITSGNGIHIVNWKKPLSQSATFYKKVNLEISRLCAGDFVGVYIVKVKGKGRAPHHSHDFLDEHHLFPEPINGLHQLGEKAAPMHSVRHCLHKERNYSCL